MARATAIKVNDKKWRAIMKRTASMNDYVKVGVLGSAGGGDPVPGGSGFTIKDIAEAHEYGIPGVLKERSYIRRTLIEKRRAIGSFIGKLAGHVLTGRLAKARALELIGAMVAGDIKRLIVSGRVTPDIAEATKKAKGSSKPLLDEGTLLNHITFEVVSR